MRADTLPARLALEHRALFAIDDPSDVDLTCREGTVWLTLDGDPRDYVLEAGDSFHTAEHRRALIYALVPAQVDLAVGRLSKPAARPSPAFRPMPARGTAH